jgi:ABC-type dipeptide/oligopeptide/nickel transport system ATPase subunit
MSEPMVQVRNVTKVYERGKQKVEVLHGLTLDIPKGDFVALMGPSGPGRSRSPAAASISSEAARSPTGARGTSASCSSSTT